MSVWIVRLGLYSSTVSDEHPAAIFRNKYIFIRLDSSTSQKTPFFIIQWVLYTTQLRKEFVLYWWARLDERRVWLFYLFLTRRSTWGTAVYSRITSTNSPSFCLTDFSARLTNLKVLVPQSRDCSCYLNRRILAPPPLPLQQTHGLTNFDVLPIVHLSIFISVINQLDAQNVCFTISLFHASTCFEHMCSSSGGQNCITQPLVSSHL